MTELLSQCSLPAWAGQEGPFSAAAWGTQEGTTPGGPGGAGLALARRGVGHVGSSQRKYIGSIWELGVLPKRGRAGAGELETALTHTLTDAHRCGLTLEYTQPHSQPHSQTWVGSWGQEARVAAASLPRNPSCVSHRSGWGGAWGEGGAVLSCGS